MPGTPEAKFGVILGRLLDPNTEPAVRGFFLNLYFSKSFLYFNSKYLSELKNAIVRGPPEKRYAALRIFSYHQKKAQKVISLVLADTERIEKFIADHSVSVPSSTPPPDAGNKPDAEELEEEPEEEAGYHDQLEKDLRKEGDEAYEEEYVCDETSCTIDKGNEHE